MATQNPLPNTSAPLVITPSSPCIPDFIKDGLGQLSRLIGTWTNKTPVPSNNSWNVMPLPQDSNPDLYILKNFAYSEELSVAAIPGTAPNRGGGFTQVCNTLFYEQRVYFSNAAKQTTDIVPAAAVNTLVHAENGSWLFLDVVNQFPGAFQANGADPVPVPPGGIPAQPSDANICKQMSVPHGNSILAVGTVTPAAQFNPLPEHPTYPENPTVKSLPTTAGKPSIPDAITLPLVWDAKNNKKTSTLYPHNSQYGAHDAATNSDYNPNLKLQNFVKSGTISDYIHYQVSGGNTATNTDITNISFEKKHSEVVDYSMDIWLLNPNSTKPILAYSQNIGIKMTLVDPDGNATPVYFPHITCNVLDAHATQTSPALPPTCPAS